MRDRSADVRATRFRQMIRARVRKNVLNAEVAAPKKVQPHMGVIEPEVDRTAPSPIHASDRWCMIDRWQGRTNETVASQKCRE